MKIEKKLHHIWVGSKPPPYKWLNTWREKNPDWEYTLWDNAKVFGRKWRNQKILDYYASRSMWHGVADIVRYEILFEQGGFMSGADAECLRPIDELFEDNFEVYAVACVDEPKGWERKDGKPIGVLPLFLREDKGDFAHFIAPIYAGKAGNPFLKTLIKELGEVRVFKEPWKTTGNQFCQRMVRKHKPEIKIWPMHYFIPEHPRTTTSAEHFIYKGDDVYALHFWGTTLNQYHKGV